MKRPILLACAGVIALAMNMPLSASAAVPGPQSDQNLRWARSRVEYDIDQMQRDQHDYDGHRVQAIGDLQSARNQLDIALAYDRYHDGDMTAAPYGFDRSPGSRSDANLYLVQRDIEGVIDTLQRDDRDYGGHRADAVSMLEAGRMQISDALRWDGRHE